jgi:hypothetical protein
MMVYVSFVVGILIQIQLVIVVLVGVAGTAGAFTTTKAVT